MPKSGKCGWNAQLNSNKNTHSKSIYCGFLSCTIVHVLEYLWKVAHVPHPEAAEKRESWVMDRTTAVLEGRAQDAAVGWHRAATRKQLDQSERQPVDNAADYIDNNQE